MKRIVEHLPLARRRDLVITELEHELIIYDESCDKAFCLNQPAALVWKHANGKTRASELATILRGELKTPVEESVVWYALRELEKDGLLEKMAEAPAGLEAITRRELIKTLGKGAAVAVPLVIMMAAPAAEAQSSPGPAPSGCVLHSTLITTAEGGEIMAREVVAGQMLLGVEVSSGETLPARVRSIFEGHTNGVYSLLTESGEVLQCSPSHPVLTGYDDTEGRQAQSFAVGDKVLVYDGESGRAVETGAAAIECIEIAQPVLMFELDSEQHTFVSGGFVSHNKRIQPI